MLKKEKGKKKKEEKTKKIVKTKKKEESYFIVLLKKRDLLFASWKIDAPVWKKRIKTAEADPKKKQYMFINVLSIENAKFNKIGSIPVHGLENSWHIFVKKEYYGKRLVFTLSYCDKKNTFYDILISKEIYIPLSSEHLESAFMLLNEDKALYELSGLNLSGTPESESTSR